MEQILLQSLQKEPNLPIPLFFFFSFGHFGLPLGIWGSGARDQNIVAT